MTTINSYERLQYYTATQVLGYLGSPVFRHILGSSKWFSEIFLPIRLPLATSLKLKWVSQFSSVWISWACNLFTMWRKSTSPLVQGSSSVAIIITPPSILHFERSRRSPPPAAEHRSEGRGRALPKWDWLTVSCLDIIDLQQVDPSPHISHLESCFQVWSLTLWLRKTDEELQEKHREIDVCFSNGSHFQICLLSFHIVFMDQGRRNGRRKCSFHWLCFQTRGKTHFMPLTRINRCWFCDPQMNDNWIPLVFPHSSETPTNQSIEREVWWVWRRSLPHPDPLRRHRREQNQTFPENQVNKTK